MSKKTLKNILIVAFFASFVTACGDRDDGSNKISKGHRDAIKIECENSSNEQACKTEIKSNFLKDGNEYADFSELTEDQIESVKWQCSRKRKYGLEAYNICLERNIDKMLGGTFFAEENKKVKPKSNIENLEQSVVYIEVIVYNKKENLEMPLISGSGVIIDKKNIATNCHVAMAGATDEHIKSMLEAKWDPEDLSKEIWVQPINEKKDWASVKLIKKDTSKDVCILSHNSKGVFKISMKPIKNFVPFKKLRKGSFVRAMGSPGGMKGHTSTGDIQWLGNAKELDRNFQGQLINPDEGKGFDENTKFIVHSARVHSGSSGGPLFDDDGSIIGLNTLISYTAAENIAVSADHIKELLNK